VTSILNLDLKQEASAREQLVRGGHTEYVQQAGIACATELTTFDSISKQVR